MRTVIFDIDGTLANVDHRRDILKKKPSDWDGFFSAMENDTPNSAVVDLYNLSRESGLYETILVSGRPERYRKLTENWLVWNKIDFEVLIMRKDDDLRADHVIKEEILEELLGQGKTIAFVVDDRKSVVDMWRKNGLTCFQCADYNE